MRGFCPVPKRRIRQLCQQPQHPPPPLRGLLSVAAMQGPSTEQWALQGRSLCQSSLVLFWMLIDKPGPHLPMRSVSQQPAAAIAQQKAPSPPAFSRETSLLPAASRASQLCLISLLLSSFPQMLLLFQQSRGPLGVLEDPSARLSGLPSSGLSRTWLGFFVLLQSQQAGLGTSLPWSHWV